MGHKEGLQAAAIVFLTLDTLVVAARVYVRTIVIEHGFGWDDFVLVLTWMGYVISLGFEFASMHYGYAAVDKQPWYDKAKITQVCFPTIRSVLMMSIRLLMEYPNFIVHICKPDHDLRLGRFGKTSRGLGSPPHRRR